MHKAVITGASKGLGKSIAKLFLESGIHVIGVARTDNKELYDYAQENHVSYQYVKADLSEKEAILSVCQTIDDSLFNEELSTLYLINNAGMVDPIGRAETIGMDDLLKNIHLNTVAPMALTNYFLQKATENKVRLVSATVTSGAAERAIYGWSAYCSGKAGVNMYTQTVALEQDENATDHAIIAFSPGVMDTAMQETIRSSSADAFKDVADFRALKANNQLVKTDLIGGILIDILTDENIENGKIYYAKDYL